jgi:hypothetical protein
MVRYQDGALSVLRGYHKWLVTKLTSRPEVKPLESRDNNGFAIIKNALCLGKCLKHSQQ